MEHMTYLRAENNMEDVQNNFEVKRHDVNFKRNFLSVKNDDEEEYGDEMVEVDDDTDEDEDDVDDESDDYGECYDGPYQFLSDEYDECDFTPQELQDFMYQQQQQSTYSMRRYSLLETIQEETSDELRMNSVSDESVSCRSDYSGVWCWGDDYPDDGTESVITRPEQKETQEQHQQEEEEEEEEEENGDNEEEEEAVFDSDEEEENPLSDREGSWLDLDDHSNEITDVNKCFETSENSWSDAIDAYLMSRQGDENLMIGNKSCSESAKLSGNDLAFKSSSSLELLKAVTTNESITSLVKDDFKRFEFMNAAFTPLTNAKSAPDLSRNDHQLFNCSNDITNEFTHKSASNLMSVGGSDHLPSDNLQNQSSSYFSFSGSHLRPSSSSHSNQNISVSGDVYRKIHSVDESEEEEEEEDEFSSDESGDRNSLFQNRSQPLFPLPSFTRPATLRSFRSFDTLHLAGTMMAASADDSDNAEEELHHHVSNNKSSSTNLQITSKSCEDLSEDSGCCDVALTSSKFITNYLQETPEDSEEAITAEDEVFPDGEVSQKHLSTRHFETFEPPSTVDQTQKVVEIISETLENLPPACQSLNYLDFMEISEINDVGKDQSSAKVIATDKMCSNKNLAAEEYVSAAASVLSKDDNTTKLFVNVDEEPENNSNDLVLALKLKSSELEASNFLPQINNHKFDQAIINKVDENDDVLTEEMEKDVQFEELRLKRSSDSFSGGWILLCLNSNDADNQSLANYYQSQQDKESSLVNDEGKSELCSTSVGFSEEEEEESDKAESSVVTPTGSVKESVTSVTNCHVESVEKLSSTFFSNVSFEVEEKVEEVTKVSKAFGFFGRNCGDSNAEQKSCKSPKKSWSLGRKMESEKQKKKSGKKHWWFLSRNKQEKNSSCSEQKISEASPPTKSENIVKEEQKSYSNDKESARLDMEKFTNSLWTDFENELKGVWPVSRDNGDAVSSTVVIAPPSYVVDDDSSVGNKSELNEEDENYAVKNKPQQLSVLDVEEKKVESNLSLTPQSQEEEEEEVNDPSVVFDKLRQIAQEGRDRAAKSVQDLNEVTCRMIENENRSEIKTTTNKTDVNEDDDISSWSSTPFWSRFCENYDEETRRLEQAANSKQFHKSNQSLVRYLETDIDTFHSREVIRVVSQSSSRDEKSLSFNSNISRHKPVKLKTQSMFNLIDGNEEGGKPEGDTEPQEGVSVDLLASVPNSRAKSMEFLLKDENKAAVEAPENRLMRLRVISNGDTDGETQAPSRNRVVSEQEERIRSSLQKLNLPDWYTNSRLHQNGSSEYLNRDGEERRSLRWEDFRNRSTSSSSIFSSNRTRSSLILGKQRVSTPDWRTVKTSRESLVQSPSSPTSSTTLDKAESDSFCHSYYTSGLSRWGSSRLSTCTNNSSRSSSPTSGLNNSNSSKTWVKQQPYLGWRSSEKLAALNNNNETQQQQQQQQKESTGGFYRSAAERLSKGPGYYALRFGIYNCHNQSNGTDLSHV